MDTYISHSRLLLWFGSALTGSTRTQKKPLASQSHANLEAKGSCQETSKPRELRTLRHALLFSFMALALVLTCCHDGKPFVRYLPQVSSPRPKDPRGAALWVQTVTATIWLGPL